MTRAFTLSEFLIVIAIIAILSVIVFPYYHSARQQLALQRAASKLAQDIRRAQEMAMSSEEYVDCSDNPDYRYGYGIFLQDTTPTQYRLFADCNGDENYSPGADEILQVNGQIEFEGGIELDWLSSNKLKVVFTPPDPAVAIVPSSVEVATIRLRNEGGQTKVVTVNKAGLIDVE